MVNRRKGAPIQKLKQVVKVCGQGDVKALEELISDKRIDLDFKDQNTGDTGLMRAAREGHLEIVYMLIDSGRIKPNKINHLGRTAIMAALENLDCCEGSGCCSRRIDAMASNGIPPDQDDPVHIRALIIKALVQEANANINIVDEEGLSAFMMAVEDQRFYLVSCLGLLGADVHQVDRAGRTPIMNAAHVGEDLMVRLLLQGGADPTTFTCAGASALSFALNLRPHAVVQQLTPEERSQGALNGVIARRGWDMMLKTVQVLLDAGAPANAPGHSSLHPILLAVQAVRLSTPKVDADAEVGASWVAVLRLLLAKGARVDCAGDKGLTPLHWVSFADNGYVTPADVGAALQALLGCPSARQALEHRDAGGCTPLMTACLNGSEAAVRALIGAKADVEAVDHMGRTPLLAVAAQAQPAVGIAQLLLDAGANVDAAVGSRTMHYSTLSHLPWVRPLSLGSDLSVCNPGVTAVFLAVRRKSNELLDVLLAAGASATAIDGEGRSVLMCRYGRVSRAALRRLACSLGSGDLLDVLPAGVAAEVVMREADADVDTEEELHEGWSEGSDYDDEDDYMFDSDSDEDYSYFDDEDDDDDDELMQMLKHHMRMIRIEGQGHMPPEDLERLLQAGLLREVRDSDLESSMGDGFSDDDDMFGMYDQGFFDDGFSGSDSDYY
jgi:ankyrin repeat protein